MLDSLKKLGAGVASLIVEDDTPKAQTPAQVGAKPIGAAATVASATQAADNEFIAVLRNALKARTTAFTSLLATADKLAAVVPDPTQRLKAAYTMVQTEGRGLTELLQAIEIHSADLVSQERAFDASLEKAKTVKLGNMRAELNSLEPANKSAAQQIANLQAQIQSLNDTITRNTTRAAELTTAITTEEQHFDLSKHQFTLAMQVVQGELAQQKAVITSTLS